MSPSPDFYTLLTDLFQKTARAPESLPAIPVEQWPANSTEQRLLENLQAAWTALDARSRSLRETEEQYRNIFDATSDGLIIFDIETGRVVEANPAACVMHGYTPAEFIGLPPTAFIHSSRQYMSTEYLQTIQAGGVFEAQAMHVRRDGSTFHVELRGMAYTYQGRACLLSIIRNVSGLFDAEQLLRQQVIRTHEQTMLLEISHTLASTLELQPGLILDQLHKIIEYTQAALFELEDSKLVALALRGTQRLEHSMPFHIQLDDRAGLVALFKEQRALRIADVQSADLSTEFLRSILKEHADELLHGVQAWMWVPLAVKGQLIGVLCVAHTKRNYFTAHQADLALTVANQAAITMVNAELNEHAQALAVLQERQHLAQNLHDAVNQSLFSAGLIAEVLPRLWERDPIAARQSLEDLRNLTRGAMAEMRALLAELRPSTLTDTDFADLLQLLGNAFTGRTNIPVSLKINGESALPADVQVAFYRICQEGLNNIAKHARASHVEIERRQIANAAELYLRDDGQGFEMKNALPGHYGLGMMRERAEAVGAILSITSQPGHGSEIVVRWTPTSKQVNQ
jgi:two-component system nitrate/nitrite sensor histidine kinase NarX